MDQNDAHWKEKYLTSLDKYEKKEKAWKELEELLRLGMNRVALAAEGVDTTLDRHLKSLRKSIRSGAYNGLESIVEDISHSVKRLDDLRKEHEKVDNRPGTVLLNLVNTLNIPRQYKSQLKELQKQLKQADPDQPIDTPLRQLATLINSTLSEPTADSDPATGNANKADTETGKSKGLLGRLFHSSTNDSPVDSHIESHTNTASLQLATQTLDVMLQHVTQMLSNKAAFSSLMDQVHAANDERTLLDTTRQLSELLQAGLSHSNDSASTPPVVLEEHSATQTSTVTEPAAESTATTPSTTTAVVTQTNSVQFRGAGSNAPQPSIAGFCLQLIETLQFPHDYDDVVQALRDKIVSHYESNHLDMAQSAEILNDIADLITHTRSKLEKEKQDLQEFLHQLTDRLKDIDQHLAGAESHTKISFNSSKNFGDMVEAQMKGIETSVQDASELKQLKSIVQDRLDAIRNHIVTYQQGEEKTHRELLDELAKSNARLHDLELETEQLRARLTQEHAQAIHDKLTGIYNRLAYEERVAQEYQRWKRYKKPLVLLVFDVDHFKSINDTYGHKAGDKALKLIAQTLQKNIRETDFLARYGGEEFVVLMPETDITAAMGVANKLRESVAAIQFNYQEKALNVTISCGATQISKGDSVDIVFQRADKFLYQAKQNGRNQCFTNDVLKP